MARSPSGSLTVPLTVHSMIPGQPMANTCLEPDNLDQTLMHRPVWPSRTNWARAGGRPGVKSISPRVFSGAARMIWRPEKRLPVAVVTSTRSESSVTEVTGSLRRMCSEISAATRSANPPLPISTRAREAKNE